MLSSSDFKHLVSGKRKGVVASLLRTALAVAEVPYTFAVKIRNRRYDRGKLAIHQAGVPVICVGNVTMGGTGKTPMVHYIARWFRERNVRVAIVSRGYGAAAGKQNDEAKELEAKLPDVPHIQNPNRVEAAELAVEELDMQLIVLDDGLQHRRLFRDMNLILVDALEPFGFEHVFPRGTLREPLSACRRAQVIALSRADLVSQERRAEIKQRIVELAPDAKWIEVAHTPSQLAGVSESQRIRDQAGNQTLEGKRVLGFCGLGNPQGFRSTLDSCGCHVLDFREFPDHHDYTRADIDSLKQWCQQQQPDLLLCTHKDFVKLEIDQLAGVPLRAVMVELEVMVGKEVLHHELERLLRRVTSE